VQLGLVVADAAAVLLSASLAILLAAPDARGVAQFGWSLVFLPGLLVLFKLYGAYEGDRRRLAHSTLDDAAAIFHGALLGTLGLWAFLKAVPAERLVLAQAALFAVLTLLFVLAGRAVVGWAVVWVVAAERVVVLGNGPSAQMIMRKIRGDRRHRLDPVGYVASTGCSGSPPERDLPCLGALGDLAAVCRGHEIERVVIASPTMEPAELADVMREANTASVTVSLLPSVVDVLGSATEVDSLEGVTMLAVNPAHFSRSSRAMKRGLDVLLSAAALLVLLPLVPLIALAIKCDSPGPVFFRQERLGRGGRTFRLVKLRTMVADAEALAAGLQAASGHSAWLLLDRDPRITRLGRILRLTSIDELPQLWNVLRGEMSLVGPRPMPPATDEHIVGWGRRRLDLTPGITGLWQVLGRASLPFEEMLRLDYLYVTNWSLWGDIRLLMRTFPIVFTRKGAN
jgi:exopolysaccharide biosynthesis polyprenyl glycosylphosphotransferase